MQRGESGGVNGDDVFSSYTAATVGQRVVARAIDVVIVGVVAYALSAVVWCNWLDSLQPDGSWHINRGDSEWGALASLACLLVWMSIVWIVSESILVGRFGQTPGKRLVGLGVVTRRTGKRPGVLRAGGRWLWLLLGFAGGPFLAVLALVVLWPLVTRDHRFLHDQLAGTAVVRLSERDT